MAARAVSPRVVFPVPVRRALVRSRVKVRILVGLAALGGKGYVAELAREARTSRQWVLAATFGDGGSYRARSSLLELGLVRWGRDVDGVVLELTALGLAAAQAWAGATTRAFDLEAPRVHA